MKTFMIIAATAIAALCGIEVVVIAALGLPFAFESVWATTRWMATEPLLLAAIMLTLILAIGRAVDLVRDYHDARPREATGSEAIAA